MSELIERQEMAIRYLLDDLSEEERTTLEQQFFSDDEVFQELEIAEDELIDRYVRTELSPEETGRFEKLLVSPRLSERVELARILAQKVPPPSPLPNPDPLPKPAPPRPWWKTLFEFSSLSPGYGAAFAGALVLLLVAGVVFFVWKRSRDESRRLAAEQQQQEERRRIEEQQTPGNEKPGGSPQQAKEATQEKEEQVQPPKEYPQKPTEPRRPAVASALPYYVPLSGTRSAGGAEKPLTLKKGVSAYDLYLDVSSGHYSRYNARLEDLNRTPIYPPSSLQPIRHRRGNYIRYRVAAEALPPGDYIVHVDGIDESGQVIDFSDNPLRVVAR